MARRGLTADSVFEYRDDLGLTCEKQEHIQWVCNILNSLHISERVLSQQQLLLINQKIRSVPTGRQRSLSTALNQVLLYLNEICDWQLPKTTESVFRDESMIWLLGILKKSECANRCFRRYEQQRQTFMNQRWRNMGWTLLVLNFEVAPLPLPYWKKILVDPSSIEFFEGQFTLKVPHYKPIATFSNDNIASFTRYALPSFPLKVLQDFYQLNSVNNLTIKSLLNAINDWVNLDPYYFSPMDPAEWLRTFQSFWHHHYVIPPALLRDLSDPMRHVATLSNSKQSPIGVKKEKALYQAPLQQAWNLKAHTPKTTRTTYWPHKALIKYYLKGSKVQPIKPATPEWDLENVLPKLFFHFTDELFTEGGVKQENLQPRSIERYTNFYHNLSSLSFYDASEPEKLHQWAHNEFERLNEQTTPWHLYNFLRSASHQELTDHLDLSLFERPELPSLVDSFRLDVSQVNRTVTKLLSSPNGNAMQRLFASVAVLLGYYGAMRRGEILRLRLSDIRVSAQNKQLFDIVITHTPEGRTKNGKTRVVSALMPASAAKLIRILLKIKSGSCGNKPLLGFEHESIHVRASQYLYPATQALKMLFGSKVRFHHLRHSGAELLYLQGLHLVYQRQEGHLEDILQDDATVEMLTHESCIQRFDFWLERRPFSQLNTGLLFDIISGQLGHANYATTRRNYIHGMEKIVPLLKPACRQYSRAELRYLFDLPAGSNDISRILNTLSSEYSSLSNKAKKQFQPILGESQVLKKLKRNQFLIKNNILPIKKTRSIDDDFASQWISSMPVNYFDKQITTFHYFCQALFTSLNKGDLDFNTVNAQWHHLARGKFFSFTAKERTALNTLGKPEVIIHQPQASSVETLNLQFQCQCNQKVLDAFIALCHVGSFKHYKANFVLQQNRKSLKSSKLNMVKTQFVRRGDSVNKQITQTGNTQLIITLETQMPSKKLKPILDGFFTHLTTKLG
ncbi:site-specific integrase [Shewanella livingstonensis]|uniref:Site-specific integrase n=1 Tax=Shewanella livingstonensis TaxID=150120 RepID=A0A3G8LWK1_9GAMM|nr:site-specific integrase [Shewanella livingstonensis]AZG74163.1 site-specific integrase [Shewanella livingstonensis]